MASVRATTHVGSSLPPLQESLGSLLVPDSLLNDFGWLFIDIYDNVSSWLASCGSLDYTASKNLVASYALDISHLDSVVTELGGAASDSPELALLKILKPKSRFLNRTLYENIYTTIAAGGPYSFRIHDLLFVEPPVTSAASA